MKELKCPNCGHVFHVDQDVFESLANQVRTAEFASELERRTEELRRQMQAQAELERERARHNYESQLERNRRELAEQLAGKDSAISRLQAAVDKNESEKKVAVLEEQNRSAQALRDKDSQLAQLRNELQAQQSQAAMREAAERDRHAAELRQKDEIITYYKDLKSRLSTKMVGESLEIHCATLFEQARAMGLFQSAYFDKDNDARSGSKGDFIFRDFVDDHEYVSIMFEMKNESDSAGVKHKNTDFLDKLDRDRREKNCEYAVLVSLLERDNELYNEGIVNMSHRYPKMYVIRPQMFMPLISLICQASRKNLQEIRSLRMELEVARAQSVDVTNFERKRDKFVETFSQLVEAHTRKHNDALENIDKVIASLEKQIEQLRKVKNLFETSQQKLIRANESAENDFTIKKLTHGNPTMRARFKEARDQAEIEE